MVERGRVGARPNLILFAVMFYYFVLGRSVVQPFLLDPLYRVLGVYPLTGWFGV